MLQQLAKPIIALAPLDGITDFAYRQIVRAINPSVVLYSEFTNIFGIERSEFVRQRLVCDEKQQPYCIQIFGNNIELYGKIAKQLSSLPINGIDLNMGCPAKHVVQSLSGGHLMREIDLAAQIVATCKANTHLPVSVKTRLGWSDEANLLPFAKRLEEAGADSLTIHGRTHKQGYRGYANWEPIYELKKQVSIPVIGNGDVQNYEDGLEKLQNLDGFMIGRAAIGNPWAFLPKEQREAVTLADKIEVMLEHLSLLCSEKEETRAVIQFRKHMVGYISGFRNAKEARIALLKATTKQECKQIAYSII